MSSLSRWFTGCTSDGARSPTRNNMRLGLAPVVRQVAANVGHASIPVIQISALSSSVGGLSGEHSPLPSSSPLAKSSSSRSLDEKYNSDDERDEDGSVTPSGLVPSNHLRRSTGSSIFVTYPTRGWLPKSAKPSAKFTKAPVASNNKPSELFHRGPSEVRPCQTKACHQHCAYNEVRWNTPEELKRSFQPNYSAPIIHKVAKQRWA